MPACEDRSLLLGGLIDGELDAANTVLIEAHVARCDGCREELERMQSIRRLLATDGLRHHAPDLLRQRIAALPELQPKAANANRLPSWLAPGVAGALAASLAMVAFVGPMQHQEAVESQLVSSHVRSLQPGHLMDVQTTKSAHRETLVQRKDRFRAARSRARRSGLSSRWWSSRFHQRKDGRRDRVPAAPARRESLRLAIPFSAQPRVSGGWICNRGVERWRLGIRGGVGHSRG